MNIAVLDGSLEESEHNESMCIRVKASVILHFYPFIQVAVLVAVNIFKIAFTFQVPY